MVFTPLRVLFGGLLVAGVILAVLNPGPDKFTAFLQERIAVEAAERAAAASGGALSGAVTDFLADRLGRTAGELAEDAFTRENYYVASVYHTDLNGGRAGGEIEFLGVANTFIPLKMPAALRDL